jgi:uncharacterized membrane protein YcaP (DUF421 family)
MDAVARAIAVYLFLILLFRIAGRRSLKDMTTFDFVLLLIISEATQQALLGDDFSITNAFIVITVLIGIDIAFGLLKQRSKLFDRLIDGIPMLLVENGRPIRARLKRARINEEDVLEAAREMQGLESMEQIKYAVLEVSGQITIVPQESAR